MNNITLAREINATVDINDLIDRVEVTINELEIENEEGCSDFVDSYPDTEVAKVMVAVGEGLIKRYKKEN